MEHGSDGWISVINVFIVDDYVIDSRRLLLLLVLWRCKLFLGFGLGFIFERVGGAFPLYFNFPFHFLVDLNQHIGLETKPSFSLL